ncbi:MAG TPA: glutamate--tRNA ligase family protein, partial [Candidatus Norongarragalinales archaeon]|nr:glutamate--tRNA ligase family protein [Candidatus Norongarragalinales archaeon]
KAVLRIKTDMSHPNASIRDWPAMRIVEEEHPRTGKKYRVWPLYNFAAPIDDHLLGITLVLRGKEHELNAEKQKYIYDDFAWKEPLVMEYGLLHIEGAMSHKSEIMEGIKAGKFTGWDDYRLPTLRGLKKRGIQPQAIRKYMISLGIKPTDSTLDWDILFKLNRLELKDADHFYFFPDPVRLEVGMAAGSLELQKNPSQKRLIPIGPAAYISKTDAGLFGNQTVRLKDWTNVDLPSGKVSDNQNHAVPKIQWVCDPVIEAKIYKPDGSIEQGIAEKAVNELKDGAMVQFERYGFCRYDGEKDGVKIFYFAHP